MSNPTVKTVTSPDGQFVAVVTKYDEESTNYQVVVNCEVLNFDTYTTGGKLVNTFEEFKEFINSV